MSKIFKKISIMLMSLICAFGISIFVACDDQQSSSSQESSIPIYSLS